MVVGRWVLGRMVVDAAMESDRITRGDGVDMASRAMVVAFVGWRKGVVCCCLRTEWQRGHH